MITNAGKDFQAAQMFSLSPGTVGANYIALTANATAPAVADTVLTGEFVTAGGGLLRAQATYAHSIGTGLTTLTKTFTANSNDGTTNTINKAGLFNAASSGTLVLETAFSSPPVLTSGDSTAITWTQNF
jgi:hypothetical protein